MVKTQNVFSVFQGVTRPRALAGFYAPREPSEFVDHNTTSEQVYGRATRRPLISLWHSTIILPPTRSKHNNISILASCHPKSAPYKRQTPMPRSQLQHRRIRSAPLLNRRIKTIRERTPLSLQKSPHATTMRTIILTKTASPKTGSASTSRSGTSNPQEHIPSATSTTMNIMRTRMSPMRKRCTRSTRPTWPKPKPEERASSVRSSRVMTRTRWRTFRRRSVRMGTLCWRNIEERGVG